MNTTNDKIDTEIQEYTVEKNSKTINYGKDHPGNTAHTGDEDYEDEVDEATWREVYEACCVHSAKEWGMIAFGIFLAVFFLYFFLFALELLGSGSKVMSGCKAGALFGDDTNPIAGLMVGILATVLLQSSSTTTSIIISLVGSTISVRQGIFMIMGANIGTSVTNTIVAIGQMGDGDQLERAFAGATVHDMFNFMTVGVLLPIEAATGFLKHLTEAMVKNYNREKGEGWDGPIKKIVTPLSEKVIISNKKLLEAVAQGSTCANGDGFYPVECEPGTPTYDTCSQVGLIACNKNTGECPAFFQAGASAKDDKISGGVCFFLAIVILFVCLAGLVTVLQKMLLGSSTRVIHKATNVNGYVAIAIGCAITVAVQSSSITTSALTPLVGIGALRLEQMYPLTLGANIGTTITGIMAGLVAGEAQNMQVSLAHLWFNVIGILIFYPIPFMRKFPLNAARKLGKLTRVWRGFPFLYIAVMFGLLPLLLLGVSTMFEQDSKGLTVLGSFVVVILALIAAYFVYWFNFKNGRAHCIASFHERERRRVTNKNLPNDMDYIKVKLASLIKHTNLPEDDDSEKKPLSNGSDEVEA